VEGSNKQVDKVETKTRFYKTQEDLQT